MTKNIAAVASTTELSDLVRLMKTLRIKRLPIVDQGRLVGIISRADFLRPVADATAAAPSGDKQNILDDQVRARVLTEMASQEWAPFLTIDVAVREGIVEFFGAVADERQRAALLVLAEKIPGVRGVLDRTTAPAEPEDFLARQESSTEVIDRFF